MGAPRTTEGPWTVGFRAYEVTAADGRMKVCDIRGWGYLTGKGGGLGLDHDVATAIQTANAHQIAASDALYDALQLVVDTYGFDPSVDSSIWQTAFAALALARGEKP